MIIRNTLFDFHEYHKNTDYMTLTLTVIFILVLRYYEVWS